jgi:dCMP deaminase
MKQIPTKHALFIQAAHKAAEKSNCIRRAVGAVIVKNGEVLANGWNGVSDAYASCGEAGCPRCIEGGSTGSGYEFCICVHAEQRAIGDAAARGVITRNSRLYVNLRPCLQCLGMIRAAGIDEVFFDEDWTYLDSLEKIYQEQARAFRSFGHISSGDLVSGRFRRIA